MNENTGKDKALDFAKRSGSGGAPDGRPRGGRRPGAVLWVKVLAVLGGLVALGVVFGLSPNWSLATLGERRREARNAAIVAELPAVEPARDGEVLIVIAACVGGEFVQDPVDAVAIRDALEAVADDLGLTNLRVAIHAQPVEDQDTSCDSGLGERYDASLVISGLAHGKQGANYTAQDAAWDTVVVDTSESVADVLEMPSSMGRIAWCEPADVPLVAWWLTLSRAYLSAGDYAQAARIAQRIVDATEEQGTLDWPQMFYFEMGWLYQTEALEDQERAIDFYSKVFEYTPRYAGAYLNRAYAYRRLGDYGRAIEDCNEVIRIDPDSADAYTARGIVYYELGEYQRAIRDYERAIGYYGLRDEVAYFNLATAHIAVGELDSALDDLNEAIEIQPDWAPAYSYRGTIRAIMGDYEQAIQDYGRAIELDPDDAQAHRDRGALYYRVLADYDRALQDFTEAIRCNPGYVDAYYGRAFCWADKGEYGMAILDYTEIIRIDPDDAVAYHNRAVNYRDAMDYEHAIADYTRAIEIDPDCAICYAGRAVIYFFQGDFDRAAEDDTEAIRIDPDNADYYHSRALTYFQAGEYEHAISDFTVAIGLQPDNAEHYYFRSFVYSDMGNTAAAEADMAAYERLKAGADQGG